MARPREFAIDDALDSAMQVFWRSGYDGASLPDLLAGMAISRGSFYKAFDDKRAVYLACLDRYAASTVAAAVASLTHGPAGTGRDRIAALLANVVATARTDRRGCFLTNASVERAPFDPDVERRVLAMMGELADGFTAAVCDSKGSVLTDERARGLGRMFATFYIGVQVEARAGATRESLRHSIDNMLSLLASAPA